MVAADARAQCREKGGDSLPIHCPQWLAWSRLVCGANAAAGWRGVLLSFWCASESIAQPLAEQNPCHLQLIVIPSTWQRYFVFFCNRASPVCDTLTGALAKPLSPLALTRRPPPTNVTLICLYAARSMLPAATLIRFCPAAAAEQIVCQQKKERRNKAKSCARNCGCKER
jgi:hypothetical protein